MFRSCRRPGEAGIRAFPGIPPRMRPGAGAPAPGCEVEGEVTAGGIAGALSG